MVAARFAVATHILLLLASSRRWEEATSLRLAAHVKTNPVVVRRINARLARAGLIRVRRGPGGAELARPPERISLHDILQAVADDGGRPLLALHARPGEDPSHGPDIAAVLGDAFARAEAEMRASLARTTLAHLLRRLDDGAWQAPALTPPPRPAGMRA